MSQEISQEDEYFDENQKSYRAVLDGHWNLPDLYEFPHMFDQCYAFVYCLDSELNIREKQRIDSAFVGYPWRGGYSYVNIYNVFQNQIPIQHRPRIKSIHKASPGWLDLFLNPDVAIQVAKSVSALAGAGVVATKSYASVVKTLSQIKVERERAKLQELQLTQSQHKTLTNMCEDMAKFLGFKNLKGLHERTGNPEVSLKLLSAHFRRTSALLEFVKDGKVQLPETNID